MNKLEILQSIKVLFVDDEEDIRSLVATTFSSLNVEFKMAGDGKEALSLYNSEEQFDLIITDINMPKMNGLVLSENIRGMDKDIPIIVLSAYTEDEFREKAKKIGVDRYMTKPFDFMMFLDLVEELKG